MSLYTASLNSGSNGNCYYVGNEDEAVLIDAGISCRETETRMGRIGLTMSKVKAIFISHEHIDHIRGLTVMAKKYQLPVYITPGTLRHGRLILESHLVKDFRGFEPVRVGKLSITAFPKLHDASEPHSFMISGNNINIGVFTDIGAPCAQLINHFKRCHAAFLEANYDEELLDAGHYPYFLKNRIRGGKGHLSNRQALDVFISHKPAYMSHLLLSHLSKDNNCPKLVHELFAAHAGSTEIIVASRDQETLLYSIGHPGESGLTGDAAAMAPAQLRFAFN